MPVDVGKSPSSSLPGPAAGITASWQLLPAAPAPPPAVGAGEGQTPVEPVPLRCWLALPAQRPPRAGVLVLPEVFGINGWVRSVAERLAVEGYAALAVPLFARTAPELELGYDEASLQLGRSHKERTRTPELLADLSHAAGWLAARLGRPSAPLGCVGFCFGGHVAMLAASLPCVEATCDFYGAGVASGRPGGTEPTLAVVPGIGGRLLCFCGDRDPLIPEVDVQAIEAALAAAPQPERHRLIRVPGAGHGYLCEARADFQPEAAAQAWRTMLAFFAEALGDAEGLAQVRAG